MKVVWTALLILLVLCVFIGIHSYLMNNMANAILSECEKITDILISEDWNTINKSLDTIETIWQSHHTWATLTLSTESIEQIEISLAQSRAFANTKQLSGFVGEFVMFKELIGHIPAHEGVHLEEIL